MAPPVGWFETDIGTVGFPGSSSVAGGVITINGSGVKVLESISVADNCHFVYRRMQGDIYAYGNFGSVVGNRECGILLRNSLAAGSIAVKIGTIPGNSISGRRVVTNGFCAVDISGVPPNGPIRLVYNAVSGRVMTDAQSTGVNLPWMNVSDFILPPSPTGFFYIGFYITNTAGPDALISDTITYPVLQGTLYPTPPSPAVLPVSIATFETGHFREGSRWYTCGRCGSNYPEAKLIVQQGIILCHGVGTHECFDLPGAAAQRRKLRIPVERHPETLPVDPEDL